MARVAPPDSNDYDTVLLTLPHGREPIVDSLTNLLFDRQWCAILAIDARPRPRAKQIEGRA